MRRLNTADRRLAADVLRAFTTALRRSYRHRAKPS